MNPSATAAAGASLDPVDRRIVRATQGGLALERRPFAAIAREIGIGEDEVMRRIGVMLDAGAIRRIAAVPNHYALGFKANGMSVWDVDDDAVDTLGEALGALPYVSHCYRRPRHLPLWPYNLFAMVHARSRPQVQERIEQIAALLGASCRAHDVLYSSAVLKKTGLRLKG